ncbi:signal peptidase II [Paenibacillus nasutitermitis]|uniref:Lipoprotein signal peptidase n=1 Tax=Paenibacillus nasutitermitis TaxID=1652958 RepID=A0A916ZGW7_9BACL|nr:signal peptidase II [Paenibacillus nasutitermitis]GGD96680.1 lipoprotein signal peptidase [Paenibacillus nasutitermitis]
MLFYMTAIIVILVDQVSKMIVRIHLAIDEDYSLWGIQLTHIENSGMAGGLFQGYARFFGIVAVLFVAGVIYYRRKEGLNTLGEISCAFLVGGAAGNGIDRLLFGQVTDFVVSRSGNGVLNMADYAIGIGVTLLVGGYVVQSLKSWVCRRCSVRY